MKRICTLLLMSLFLFANGFANEVYYDNYFGDSCCNTNCCNDKCCFKIAGEWLYMLSAIDEPYYAVGFGTGPVFSGDREGNKGEWHSGYRIDAAYCLPCCDYLRARWTGFCNFTNRDSFDELNYPVQVIPPGTLQTSANSRNRFKFNYLDVVYGRKIYCCRPISIGIEGGIQYAMVRFKERVTYVPDFITKNRARLHGIGPEAALLLDYSICNSCFSIVSRSAASFLISKKHAHTETAVGPDGEGPGFTRGNTTNKHYWFATPAFDIRVGLNYHTRFSSCICRCLGIELEAGYEFIHIFKGVDRIYFVDTVAPGQSFTQNMDFTLHGPYVRLGLVF